MKNPEDQKGDSGFSSYTKAIRSAGPLFGSGVQLAASVVLMFFVGKWLDEQLNTAPWLMLSCLCFGFGAGLYNFIKIVSRVDRGKKEKRKKVSE